MPRRLNRDGSKSESIGNLSPPSRAQSRERSRSRDPSPFARESRLHLNRSRNLSPARSLSPLNMIRAKSLSDKTSLVEFSMGQPNNKVANEIPILEDDELDDESETRPILPIFGDEGQETLKNDENEVSKSFSENPFVLKGSNSLVKDRKKRIQEEIEGDFDKEFYKDSNKTNSSMVERKLRRESHHSIERDLGVSQSSSDESTDSTVESYSDDDLDKDHEYAESYNLDDLSLQRSHFNSHFGNFYPENSSLNNNRNEENEDPNDVDNHNFAGSSDIESIDTKVHHSIASRWFHFPRISLGSRISNSGQLSNKSKREDDIESKLLSNNILREAEALVKKYTANTKKVSSSDLVSPYFREFDELEPSTSSGSINKVRSGVTSNLIHLYDEDTAHFFSDSDLETVNNNSEDAESIGKFKYKIKKLNMANNANNKKISSIFHMDRMSSEESSSKMELPSFKKANSSEKINLKKKFKKKKMRRNTARITVHIADLLQRQKFLLTLCKAFMIFGAPNHRLEEYLGLTARVLEIDSSFLYFPGIMLVSFGDPTMRTTDMKLVRVGQGLDLGKLDEAHDVYNSVVHDRMGVEEASEKLEQLLARSAYFNKVWIVLFYGISSAFVIIWFNGSWLDMIPSFVLGALLGFLQVYVAPKNSMYSSVFEVGSAILLSFIGRAIGSIANGKYFCFSAVVQSGLCMILPGYIILSGALEIQSRSIVSGTVRMFYAIIYSLFLGFGLTLGSALYGWIDKSAISTTVCKSNIKPIWNLLFIPFFTLFMGLACQARWHQMPIMLTIACAGYTVDYFSSLHFGITQFNAALGSFTVGLLSNLYSRWGRPFRRIGYCSTAFTSMLCGIFDLVPGGVATRNVLAAGIIQLETEKNNTSSSTSNILSDSTLTFGITMIEVAIGITVGLFLSSIVVYPLGKKKTGLFSL